jgi:hyaluronoglucosaminidase
MNNKMFGVIEGFYGQSWSWAQRHELLDMMADWRLNSYLYAPKSDAFLRRKWREEWDQSTRAELIALSNTAKKNNLFFGVGLSLVDFHESQDQQALYEKIKSLNALKLSFLGVFFDDMRGDLPGLIEQQIAALRFIRQYSDAQQIIFCPTYYSFDPVLENVFGVRPYNYWKYLAANLPIDIQVFWTGPKVISDSLAVSDLVDAYRLTGRRVAVWDNYPVNDGRVTSNYLHLRPSPKRKVMTANYTSYFINPMNQYELSLPVLASAFEAVHGGSQGYGQAMAFAKQRWGDDFAEFWWEQSSVVQDLGLLNTPESTLENMRHKLQGFDNPASREWLDWLNGVYTFDPACLTE